MTSTNNRTLLQYYVKLCTSFQIHRWIQTGFTVRKRPIWVKIEDNLSRMTLKFDRWLWNTISHPFYTTLSSVHYFKAMGEIELEVQSGNGQFGSTSETFVPYDLEIWLMTLKNNRAPLLCCFKLCASFRSHWWIQTGVIVRKCPIWIKINDFFSRVTLKFNGWPWKSVGHYFLCCFKLCASFRSHWWLQTGVIVRKRPIWVKIDIFLAMWPWNLTGDLEKQ